MGAKPSIDVLGPKTREARTNILSDLVAARADGGSDGDEQVGRTAAELRHKPLDCDERHARRQTSPARVGGGDRPSRSVNDEDRQAISDTNRDRPSGIIREENVGLVELSFVPFRVSAAASQHDGSSAVNLPQATETRWLETGRIRDLNPSSLRGHGRSQLPPACREEVGRER
jgi:hypothetical protein